MPHSHGHTCESQATHHDHDHSHSPPPEETHEMESLYSKIDLTGVRAINERVPESAAQIIKPWDQRFSDELSCMSNVDGQIILHVPFVGQIKLKSILLRCPATTSAAKEMYVYVNRDDLDFTNVDDAIPIETFECVAYEHASDMIEYPVKTRLYRNVRSITLYFKQHWSDDEDDPLILYYLGFRGDHTEIRTGPISVTYEAFANPKDHKVRGFNRTSRKLNY